HLLGEILSTADRVVVMRDGKVEVARPARAFTRASLVSAMGSVAREEGPLTFSSKRVGGSPMVQARPRAENNGRKLTAFPGEIVGLAGLSGHGQTDLLFDLVTAGRGRANDVLVAGPMALVAGDRQSDGIFPLWSIAKNIGIRSLRSLRRGPL